MAQYINAAQLAIEWKCSLRTAQKAIKRVNADKKVKRGRYWYVDPEALTRPRIGNPNMHARSAHQVAAALARWRRSE